ncbi:unnamed protein product [Ectocarpus sp. 4 AP-2014]
MPQVNKRKEQSQSLFFSPPRFGCMLDKTRDWIDWNRFRVVSGRINPVCATINRCCYCCCCCCCLFLVRCCCSCCCYIRSHERSLSFVLFSSFSLFLYYFPVKTKRRPGYQGVFCYFLFPYSSA